MVFFKNNIKQYDKNIHLNAPFLKVFSGEHATRHPLSDWPCQISKPEKLLPPPPAKSWLRLSHFTNLYSSILFQN